VFLELLQRQSKKLFPALHVNSVGGQGRLQVAGLQVSGQMIVKCRVNGRDILACKVKTARVQGVDVAGQDPAGEIFIDFHRRVVILQGRADYDPGQGRMTPGSVIRCMRMRRKDAGLHGQGRFPAGPGNTDPLCRGT